MTDNIFEPTIESLQAELQKLKGNKAEVAEPTPKTKAKKPRKPLDEKTKERLRAQLAKGRATSLAKRRAKREQNKITKAKEIIAEEEQKEAEEEMPSTKTNEELKLELKALKEKMEKPKRKKKKLPVIVEESESEEEEESEEESEEEEIVIVKKKKSKKPKAQPKQSNVKEVSHIPIVEKKIEAPDPMALWLQKRKKSKYS